MLMVVREFSRKNHQYGNKCFLIDFSSKMLIGWTEAFSFTGRTKKGGGERESLREVMSKRRANPLTGSIFCFFGH